MNKSRAGETTGTRTSHEGRKEHNFDYVPREIVKTIRSQGKIVGTRIA